MALLQCPLQQGFRPPYMQSQIPAFPHFVVHAGTCTVASSASICFLFAIPTCFPKTSLTISQEKKKKKKYLQCSFYFNMRFNFLIISKMFDLKCASGISTSRLIAGKDTGLDLALKHL